MATIRLTLDHGSDYMRADEQVWQQMFDVYESMIDPVGSFTATQLLEDDSYVQRMVAGYEKLQRVNAEQLDEVELTNENRAFLNKLLAVAALEPFDMQSTLHVFSSLGLDTATAPDVNMDNAPDCAVVREGKVTWNGGGSFTAETDSLVVFTTVLKNEGDYHMTVEGGASGVTEVQIDGRTVEFTANGDTVTAADDSLGNGVESTVAVRVTAGTTIDRITYERE